MNVKFNQPIRQAYLCAEGWSVLNLISIFNLPYYSSESMHFKRFKKLITGGASVAYHENISKGNK